jgi:hypothetical protein
MDCSSPPGGSVMEKIKIIVGGIYWYCNGLCNEKIGHIARQDAGSYLREANSNRWNIIDAINSLKN